MMLQLAKCNTDYLNTPNNVQKKYTPHHKSNDESLFLLNSFIEGLRGNPSHYCRNKSTKLYLPDDFRNIKGV